MENIISIFNTIFLIIGIFLAIMGIFTTNQKKLSENLKISDKHYRLIIIAILIIAIIIRLWQFGFIPGGFNQDGAMASVDALALAKYGTDRFGTWLPAHLYAWGYGQMSALLSYLMAIFIKLFGLSTITARLPQLLASIMGGIFFYLFAKDNLSE